MVVEPGNVKEVIFGTIQSCTLAVVVRNAVVDLRAAEYKMKAPAMRGEKEKKKRIKANSQQK